MITDKNTFDSKTVSNIPKFIKIYGKNNRNGKWYKIIRTKQDGTDVMVPASSDEIKIWKLK